MESPKEQSNQHQLNLPSPQSRVDDQVSRFIKHGLNLAYEIEAALLSSTHQSGSEQTSHSDPQGADDPYCDSLQTPELPHSNPIEQTTYLQRHGLEQLTVEPELTEAQSWAMVWLRRGLYKFSQADYIGAQDNFQKALHKQPTLAAAHNGLGGVFYKQREFLEAIMMYNQALDNAPQNAQIYCNLGSTHYQLQKFKEAALAYQQAIGVNPHLQLAYYGLGLAYFRLGFCQDAVTAFSQATQLNFRHADSFLGLGIALYSLGDTQETLMALYQAMQLNPQHEGTYLTFLGFLYL